MTPWILMTGLAVAQESPAANTSYADGYRMGWSYGASTQTVEWAAYGAAGSCFMGAPGCVGVTAIGYSVDPANLPPLSVGGAASVPRAALGTTPPAPVGTLDPELWAQGYEGGWDARVQRDRARWALVGGASVPLIAGTAYVGVLAGTLFLQTQI